MLIIMETEIWPNLIKQGYSKNIPIAIVNGRISDKAYSRYKIMKLFFRPFVSKINILCMQTECDAQRIEELGAVKKNIKITGNVKFDQVLIADKNSKFPFDNEKNECLIVAGSTHDNEEEIISKIFSRLKQKHSNIRLLLAPRHPQRATSIAQGLKKQGFDPIYLSALGENDPGSDKIFILNSMGMLNALYSVADIVFVGGSMVAHGGQNPIEPAALAKPIVFGPHMFNFSKIVQIFLENQAAIQINNEQQLYEVLNNLIEDKQKRLNLAMRAKEVVENNRGSVDRIMRAIDKEIGI